jgi:acetyl-CoA C-acetyltransferase
MKDVAIIGIGYYGFAPTTNEVSFREGSFIAASRAYSECNVDPRKDVDSFIACEEDYNEGIAISNEFSVDQLGAVLKPVSTVTSESLIALASGYLQIKSGLCDIVVVESHSKASNISSYEKILELSLDPIYERFLNVHPYYLASLEARYYMEKRGLRYEDLALVIKKNKENGLNNPRGSYSSKVDIEAISKSNKIFDPLSIHDIAPLTDAFLVVVLASREKAEELSKKPIWIEGIYWCTESVWYTLRSLDSLKALEKAAERLYEKTGINPKQIDFAEIDDRFSYRELMHLEALKISNKYELVKDLRQGRFNIDGDLPINPSGGYLSTGVPLDAGGLAKVYEAVLQLRNEAGKNQLKDAKRALIMSWRGITTSTYGVCILSNSG